MNLLDKNMCDIFYYFYFECIFIGRIAYFMLNTCDVGKQLISINH